MVLREIQYEIQKQVSYDVTRNKQCPVSYNCALKILTRFDE